MRQPDHLPMPRVLNFYLDDSGTRAPNRKPLAYSPKKPDFFALGGILVNEEDEAPARKLYSDFCARWSIGYPLHSVEIRHCRDNFTWLKRDTAEYARFMNELTRLLTSINVIGLACVIDRPGYDARYREKYGRRPGIDPSADRDHSRLSGKSINAARSEWQPKIKSTTRCRLSQLKSENGL
jgi:hypothetical protein